MKRTKIFILDDHKIIRDGLKSILNQTENFIVAGEEGDPLLFLDKIKSLDFDILLLDLTFPNVSGFDLIPRIKKLRPDFQIVILSMHNNPEYMQRCLMLGAHCYLPKDIDAKDVIVALEKVRAGGSYIAASIPLQLKPLLTPGPSHLSQRELEVLRHLANGFSSKQIAAALSISTRTVEVHRLNIMKKLGSSNSAETISKAVKLNLL